MKPKIKLLYVNEPGPGRDSVIKLLQGFDEVEELIDADVRYRVGDHAQNAKYIENLRVNWDREDLISKEEISKFVDRSLEEQVDYYLLHRKVNCIFISGSRFDPSSEHCMEEPTRITPDIRREQFEIKLIQRARDLGITILAVCAGTWRVASAYGGKTQTVPEEHLEHHEEWGIAVRAPDRMTIIADGSMLQSIHIAAQKNKLSEPNLVASNSTHWRECKAPETQDNTAFNFTFESNAYDAIHSTVEGYESKYGVPVMCVQGHPEYVKESVVTKESTNVFVPSYETHRAIIKNLVNTGQTHRCKQEFIEELKKKTKGSSKQMIRAKL